MISPRWCFLVRWQCPHSGVVSERRFLWERSAREYGDQLDRAGFRNVSTRAVRVKVNQRREATAALGTLRPEAGKRIFLP